jgi:hypothetical protein
LYRWIAVVLLEMRQMPIRLLTDERHGNRKFKNGQHVFTMLARVKILEKSVEKLWNACLIVCFVTLNSGKRADESLNDNSGV